MKKQALILALLVATVLPSILSAQTGFKWQGLAKDAAGNPVTQSVTLTFTILQNNVAVYTESHPPITPVNGQLTATVGMGAPTGVFSDIDWSVASLLNVKMQVGSGAVLDMGTSEILSSPLIGGQWLQNGNNVYRVDGNVGIGTNNPINTLTVTSDNSATNVATQFGIQTSANPNSRLYLGYQPTKNYGSIQALTEGVAYRALILNPDGGNIGIGTNIPSQKLDVNGNVKIQGEIFRNDGQTDLHLYRDNDVGNWSLLRSDLGSGIAIIGQADNVGIAVSRTNTNVGIRTLNPTVALDVNGNTKTKILEITGGSDFAESFDITSPQPEPGMLVSIDPEHPGQLKVTTESYDRKIAGVISGAGGIAPGMVMGQEESIANGKYPVAMVGRVYVNADATFGVIKPGDLLTASPSPGIAMKVGDYQLAQNAVIGKAMTALSDGKGLVLVLVNLQ